MAFDNVTLFEINVADPLGRESGTETGRPVERPVEPEAETGSSSGGLVRLLGLAVAGAVLAGAAYWLFQRRQSDDETEFSTEEIEPGVERVES